MTTVPADHLSAIEEQRRCLEKNLKQLHNTLLHWHIWEFEYEGIKEEIDGLPENTTPEELVNVARSFDGDLVNEQEVRDLIGSDWKTQRTPKQIVGVIARRLEYVQQNQESIQRRLNATHGELTRLSPSNDNPTKQESGLPFTEIFEELDNDGRVVAGTTSRPMDSEEQIWDTLRKAGVESQDLEESDDVKPQHDGHDIKRHAPNVKNCSDSHRETPETVANGAQQERITTNRETEKAIRPTMPRKKSVSFAEGTKEQSAGSSSDPRTRTAATRNPLDNQTTEVAKLAKGAFRPTERVVELDENDNAIGVSNPIIPEDESPNDAALRREMLQYSLNEVGSIVAQLDLEEVESSEYSEEDDDDTDLDSASGGDEEDQHGLSMRSSMSDSYRQRMLDLEKKLDAQMFQNLGPQRDERALDQTQANAGFSLRDETANEKATEKTVRFADDIEVAHGSPRPSEFHPSQKPSGEASNAVSDTIIERPANSAPVPAEPKKASLFKNRRVKTTPAPPAGDDGLASITSNTSKPPPLLSDVMEKPLKDSSTRLGPISGDDDETDPTPTRKEIANDYYRQRNRLIEKQGGFVKSGAINADENGEHVPPRKVSLFKSARVKGNAE